MAQLRFQCLRLGDVTTIEHDAADVIVPGQVRGEELIDPATPFSVLRLDFASFPRNESGDRIRHLDRAFQVTR